MIDIVAIVTVIISVISLITLIYQSVNIRITIENQIYQSFINNSVELDKILIEYPSTRKYIYDGAPVDANTDDLNRIMSIVEMVVDVTENIEVYTKFIPEPRRKGWIAFVNDIQKTPAYDYYMKKYGHWYKIER